MQCLALDRTLDMTLKLFSIKEKRTIDKLGQMNKMHRLVNVLYQC